MSRKREREREENQKLTWIGLVELRQYRSVHSGSGLSLMVCGGSPVRIDGEEHKPKKGNATERAREKAKSENGNSGGVPVKETHAFPHLFSHSLTHATTIA